ncbi:MAG: glycosyltransferase family 9 protein [Xanthomonadales bacterium]|nr:glycosyltransferase family 9 protein [Xanthomonadales bacterium]
MQRVLVVRIGRFGDTIMATPVIEALYQAFGPAVSIDFAASPGASAYILELDSRVNKVFSIAHRSTPWRFHRVKREIEQHSRDFPYDLVINLECGRECDDFIKFAHHHEFCGRPLKDTQHRPNRHCVDTEKSIYAEILGPDVTNASDTSLQLKLDATDLTALPDSAYVVINPGFSGVQRSGYRSHRGWPAAHWQKLIGLLNGSDGLSVLINGTHDEQPYFESLLQLPGVHSLFGSSIPGLATALLNAKGLITVDTGTMHLAMALGTPVLALFGPSNPELTGPYSSKVSHRVLLSGVDCQPCINTPAQKQCSYNRCMFGLEPQPVYEACRELFNE